MKKCILKKQTQAKSRISALVLSSLLLLSLPSTSLAAGTDQVSDTASAIYMNHVDTAMLHAEYWCGKSGDVTLLSPTEIETFNEKNYAKTETHLEKLASSPEKFDGNLLKSQLAQFKSPKGLYQGTTPVSESFYEGIRKNILAAKTTSDMRVRYGIVTSRSTLRNLASLEMLSDDPTDPDWDNETNSALLIGEPVCAYITTGDGAFTYVHATTVTGWVPTTDIAICQDKTSWLKAAEPERFLIVTGDEILTEDSSANPAHSAVRLSMGTKLALTDSPGTVDNRMSWYNYVVLLPGRDAYGNYMATPASIPMSRDVHEGYLPFTEKNLLQQAFKSLGNAYGWGGSLQAQDCSSYVREVYLCFGFVLPRNTTWQGLMDCQTIDLSQMSSVEKEAVLSKTPGGAILQFPGHEMLYLGSTKGDYFTINDVSSLLVKDENGSAKRYRGRCVIVNGLKDTYRASGKSWLESSTKIIIPWAAK